MESRSLGGVYRRLERLKEAVEVWLEWEEMQFAPDIEREDFRLQLIENGRPEPHYPEPLRKYRRYIDFKLATYSGGLWNQPHIELMEFQACEAGIGAYQTRKIQNELLKKSVGSHAK